MARKRNKNKNSRKSHGGSLVKIDHDVQVVRLPRTFYGFPPRLETVLRYSSTSDLISLSSIAGTFASYGFRANSIFDPDYSGTGHQPMWRDTFAAVYDQYAVVSSRIKLRYLNSNATGYWNVGAYIEDDVAWATSIAQAEEMSSSKSQFLGAVSSSLSRWDTVIDWDCVSMLGIDPYASETYKTSLTTNPTEQAYFVAYGADFSGGTTSVIVVAEIEYVVLFTELQTAGLS